MLTQEDLVWLLYEVCKDKQKNNEDYEEDYELLIELNNELIL